MTEAGERRREERERRRRTLEVLDLLPKVRHVLRGKGLGCGGRRQGEIQSSEEGKEGSPGRRGNEGDDGDG